MTISVEKFTNTATGERYYALVDTRGGHRTILPRRYETREGAEAAIKNKKLRYKLSLI